MVLSLLDKKFQFTYVQATGETLSSQKKTSTTFKKINFFLCLWVIFALLDPDPQQCEDLIDLAPGTL